MLITFIWLHNIISQKVVLYEVTDIKTSDFMFSFAGSHEDNGIA